MLGANLVLSRVACLEAAASGQPDKLRWVFLLVETWPRPLQPGVGHLRMVSCMARTGTRGDAKGRPCHLMLIERKMCSSSFWLSDVPLIWIADFLHIYTAANVCLGVVGLGFVEPRRCACDLNWIYHLKRGIAFNELGARSRLLPFPLKLPRKIYIFGHFTLKS